MPKVGNKTYSYSRGGMKKAKAAAKKSGKKITYRGRSPKKMK